MSNNAINAAVMNVGEARKSLATIIRGKAPVGVVDGSTGGQLAFIIPMTCMMQMLETQAAVIESLQGEISRLRMSHVIRNGVDAPTARDRKAQRTAKALFGSDRK